MRYFVYDAQSFEIVAACTTVKTADDILCWMVGRGNAAGRMYCTRRQALRKLQTMRRKAMEW